jgi:FkbM family methyltransferase
MKIDEWHKTYRWQEHGHKYFEPDFKFLWPVADSSLHGDIPTLAHLDKEVFPLVKEKRIAVQAGGAMGMWAKRMAQVFKLVYTFEPTPQSFNCLTFNCPEENIVAFNAALGDERKMCRMGFPEHASNFGGFRCLPGGYIPTLRLDDLALPELNLLMLDLEGFELFALRGGAETIAKCRPVIVMEDKGCSRAFGYEKGAVEHHLKKTHGYKTLKRFHGGRDVVCIPSG